MMRIRLTGHVLDWDHEEWDELTISPDEAKNFEAKGYSVTSVQDFTIAFRETTPPDGDIQIQPKSDAQGRSAASGGYTNRGYSGYFKGFVYLGGKRKTLVDWWTLFPGKEHHYAAQQDKSKAEANIREIIQARIGTEVAKVKGGYAFAFED